MRYLLAAAAGVAWLAACGGEQPPTAATPTVRPVLVEANVAADQPRSAAVLKDLAALRRATAPFLDFQRAVDAGYGTMITSCMTSPDGGMGFHYGNTDLIDGSVNVTTPELLLYEPEGNGRLRLVAVEYIIPYAFHSRDAEPPTLFGQPFQQVDAFQLWGLHAWVWRDNPSGIFAPWNPRVNCDNAADVMSMATP